MYLVNTTPPTVKLDVFSEMMDWLVNSLLHKLDIFAGYEIDFLLKKTITIISV